MPRLALAWLALVLIGALLAPSLAPGGPFQPVGSPLSPPGGPHLLGTDHLGRDLLARMLFGGRLSLGASAAASLLTVLLGGSLGLAAALLGGVFDAGLRWLANVLLAIPGLLLAMLLAAGLGPGLGRLLVRAILQGDFPIAQGIVGLAALFYVGTQVLADLMALGLDPRIRGAS